MNRYLLDTHVLNWSRQNDSRLPHKWDKIFLGKETEVIFSIVSVWEIAIARCQSKFGGAIENSG